MSEDGVTYSFKDLFDKFDKSLSDGFQRLDGRLDEINRKIDSKADNTRVADLEKRHASFETRIEERFENMAERFKPLENFVLTTTTGAVIRGRGLAWLAALAIAIIGSLVYVAFSGVH